jgi:hypothetical protein
VTHTLYKTLQSRPARKRPSGWPSPEMSIGRYGEGRQQRNRRARFWRETDRGAINIPQPARSAATFSSYNRRCRRGSPQTQLSYAKKGHDGGSVTFFSLRPCAYKKQTICILFANHTLLFLTPPLQDSNHTLLLLTPTLQDSNHTLQTPSFSRAVAAFPSVSEKNRLRSYVTWAVGSGGEP